MVTAIIPARSGSMRIPNKNLQHVGGMPLLSIAVRKACNADIFQKIIVSSDDPAYLDVAKGAAEGSIDESKLTLHLRPDYLSSSSSADQDLINSLKSVFTGDEIALVRPTNPFMRIEDMREAVSMLETHDEGHEIRTVRAASEHPMKMWKLKEGLASNEIVNFDKDYRVLSGLPTVCLIPAYAQSAGIEVRRLSKPRGPIYALYVDGVTGFDINTDLDLKLANLMVEAGIAHVGV